MSRNYSPVLRLIVRELIPVAGILLADWNVIVVAYLFWFETFIIFCYYLMFFVSMLGISLAASARTGTLAATLRQGTAGAIAILMGTALYLSLGAAPGYFFTYALYTGLETGHVAGNPINPLVFLGRSLEVMIEYNIWPAIIALVAAYIMEVTAYARAVMVRIKDPGERPFLEDLLFKGLDKVDEVFRFRMGKLYLLSFLMVSAGAVVFATSGDELELGRWTFVGVFILKIGFDISNLPREQDTRVETAGSSAFPDSGGQANARISRTNRGQVWLPRNKGR